MFVDLGHIPIMPFLRTWPVSGSDFTCYALRVKNNRLRILALAVPISLLLLSCNKTEPSVQERSRELQGTWEYMIRHDCQGSPIRSDTLSLHPDGTFDQQTVTKDGRSITSVGQHWAYMEKNSISLDKRRDWDNHSDPSFARPRPDTATSNSGEGIAEFEVLIVQFGSRPVILVNPDSDCLYVKTK